LSTSDPDQVVHTAELQLAEPVFCCAICNRSFPQKNDGSLLVKQLGIYCVKMNWFQQPVWFQVMENVHKGLAEKEQDPQDPQKERPVGLKFDLKGSNNQAKSKILCGDLSDLRDREMRHMLIEKQLNFKLDNPEAFSRKLSADVSMLMEAGLMDYSLMLWALRPAHESEEQLNQKVCAYMADARQHLQKVRDSTCCNQAEGLMRASWTEEVQATQTAIEQHIAQATDGIDDIETIIHNTNATDIRRRTKLMFALRSTQDVDPAARARIEQAIKHLQNLIDDAKPIIDKAQHIKDYTLEALLGAQVEKLTALSKCLHQIFIDLPPPKRSRSVVLADAKIGTCKYIDKDTGEVQEFEVACGISDVATGWGLYPQLTEIGKTLQCHKSRAADKFKFHTNDWGLSAKPPHLYGARFEESLCLYFNVDRKPRAGETTRYGMHPIRPATYYLGQPSPSP